MTDVPDNLIVLEDLIQRRKLQEFEKELKEEVGAPLDEETKLWLGERLKALEASKRLSLIKTDKDGQDS